MLNSLSRTWRVCGGVWLAAVVLIVAYSAAVGAKLSTSALLFVIGAVPMGVVLMIRRSAASPTVAELLYSVDKQKDGRS